MEFQNEKLINDEDKYKYEYHFVRFEGMVQMYQNSVADIIKMRNNYRQCKYQLKQNKVLENVECWQLTDLDHFMDHKI